MGLLSGSHPRIQELGPGDLVGNAEQRACNQRRQKREGTVKAFGPVLVCRGVFVKLRPTCVCYGVNCTPCP